MVSGALQPPNEIERQHLSSADLAKGFRLICQARSSGGEVVVHSLPEASDFGILTEGCGDLQVGDSNLHIWRVQVPQALPESRSEWERLEAADNGVLMDQSPPLSLLRMIPEALSSDPRELEVVSFADRVIRVRPAEQGSLGYYGIACDIGTTTLVAYLVDLRSGKVLGAIPRANPQAAHGADVMSRIDAASTKEGLQLLHSSIITAIEEMAATLAASNALTPNDIAVIGVVGNTCMHHLFLGLSPIRLGQAPYLPVHRGESFTRGATLGMDVFAETLLWSAPLIGGFVGSDAVAAAVAGQLLKDDKPRLLVDLGTNGEVLLSARGRILACSAAAGPAFEGVQILYGMRAEPGAIDEVRLHPEGVDLHVLGDEPARGICGSGLLDLVAELVRLQVIDETGRLRPPEEIASSGLPGLAAHVIETDEQIVFRLTDSPQIIDFTQKDVRQVQLAKAAIRAAIDICCVYAEVSPDDLDEVLLAGAFGTYIRKESALRIGLLPSVPLPRIRSLGNAAGAGAVLALTSESARMAFIELAQKAEHIDLGSELAFQERFVEAMLF
ncbi:MAG: ATP-binding protein [Firmicutes bacterium]|nr:ATP-binding protein [Bacillota bacterium]